MSTQEATFRVMGKIESDLKIMVEKKSKELESDEKFEKLVKANNEFKNLIEKGLITPRGNQLLSSDELHQKKFHFNTK